MTNLQNMITAIQTTQGARDFVVGSEDIEVVAQEWINEGFTTSDAVEWWGAGCFDPMRAAALRDFDLQPSDVSGKCPGLNGCSWGYAHSNYDVPTQAVITHCKR